MNGSVATHMGAMRAKNGHPQPYHIKFWNIGNEPWGSWQIGRTDTKYFMLKHNEFAKAMRAVDPSIVLIASGRMLQEDGSATARYARSTSAISQPLYGTIADWTGNFLAHTLGNFDGIAEHWYSQPGRRFDMEKARALPPDASDDEAYVKVDQTLLESARYRRQRRPEESRGVGGISAALPCRCATRRSSSRSTSTPTLAEVSIAAPRSRQVSHMV